MFVTVRFKKLKLEYSSNFYRQKFREADTGFHFLLMKVLENQMDKVLTWFWVLISIFNFIFSISRSNLAV